MSIHSLLPAFIGRLLFIEESDELFGRVMLPTVLGFKCDVSTQEARLRRKQGLPCFDTVVLCPYCQSYHLHGHYDGVEGRTSHCSPGGEYMILPIDHYITSEEWAWIEAHNRRMTRR